MRFKSTIFSGSSGKLLNINQPWNLRNTKLCLHTKNKQTKKSLEEIQQHIQVNIISSRDGGIFADSARSDSACFFLAFNPMSHLLRKSFPSKYICYHKDADWYFLQHNKPRN